MSSDKPAIPPPDALDTVVQISASMIPFLGGPLAVFAEHERQRFNARTQEFGDQLMLEVPRPILEARLEDERYVTMLVRAALGAGSTAWEEKRKALGRTVAAAFAGDDAVIDDSELAVEALIDLDRPHFATLARLQMAQDANKRDGFSLTSLEPTPHPSAVSGLERHGLISDAGIDGGSALYAGGYLHVVTAFGQYLLDLTRT